VLASVPLMLEYEAVLTRPEDLRQAGLTIAETNSVLDALAAVIEPVKLRFLWRPRLPDPADEMVLETAVNGRADRIATFNLRHLGAAAAEFGIRANPPGKIWRDSRIQIDTQDARRASRSTRAQAPHWLRASRTPARAKAECARRRVSRPAPGGPPRAPTGNRNTSARSPKRTTSRTPRSTPPPSSDGSGSRACAA
jgi:PIN domain